MTRSDSKTTDRPAGAGVRLVRVDYTTGLLPTAASTQTILEAYRPDTEPTNSVSTSPFVFGGSDPIDPRALSGLADVFGPTETQTQQRPQQQQEQSEDLGGLY